MPNTRTRLIEAAHVLLATTSREPSEPDLTGEEIAALYKTIDDTRGILMDYTITEALPELREGARSTAAQLQIAMWILETAWTARYADAPRLQNVASLPLRRTA